ncbi:hypothetical protein CCACVL1_19281 [Corchorus capsularis]|uniref:Uncharacterized protein n=1 Tax=Corchorus capsularis TaxID=210143 RepID=A0A1R3HHC4_COCAP|nr:hypothetical protein CCACVL1_19281 [Corchorus capsularis]
MSKSQKSKVAAALVHHSFLSGAVDTVCSSGEELESVCRDDGGFGKGVKGLYQQALSTCAPHLV